MANTNYAIKLYKTSESAKRVGINVTNSTDTTGYALYVNGNTKIAGDAEITNGLTVNSLTTNDTGFINSSSINVDKRNNYSDPGNIWFIVGDSSSREGGGLISISEQTSSNKKVPSTLNFYIRSYSNGTISNYGEHYSLPVVNSGLSSTQYYNILTSKNAVTVAQGGTGRTTLTSNAVLTGNGTSSIKMVATAKGAAYATSANGALTFGTLPIAQGGTGSTTAANARSNLGITPTNIGAATSGHIHGYITNSGTIDEDPISIANNDRIVVLDADDNYSLVDSGIIFDGSTETQCLTKKGTWIDIFDKIYPVGAIYISTNNTSPATLFGGTWVQIKDTFLLSAGDTYAAGNTGGASTHYHGLSSGFAQANLNGSVIRFNELEGKYWAANARTGGVGYVSEAVDQSWAWALGGTTDSSNNMPPYLAVYVWERTA